MKQILSGWMLLMFMFVPSVASAAGAAVMNLSADSVETEFGQQFDLVVSVEPNGEELDTARAVLTFDPTLLQVQNVSLTGAFDRSAPGNYFDNTSGKISWGGFTLEGPVTQSTPLATITFLATQQGSAQIDVSSDSKAISAGEEKIDISSLESSSITVTESATLEEGVALLVVSSGSHINDVDWYPLSTVDLSWVTLEEESPITAYYYTFDQASNTDPATFLSADTTEISIEDVEDGVHYFHLKGVQADGKETPVVHRRVNVDTTAPNPIELIAQDTKLLEGESVWLTFATTDETSGVLQYQVAINDSAYQVQSSPLEIEDLEPGTYFFRVAALDRAGNSTYQARSVRVYPEGTELDRPEGLEEASEIEAIVEGTFGDEQQDGTAAKSTQLLITLLLGALVAFGIIYAIFKRKK